MYHQKRFLHIYFFIGFLNIFWIIFHIHLENRKKKNIWENRLNTLLESTCFKILNKAIALLDFLIFMNSN